MGCGGASCSGVTRPSCRSFLQLPHCLLKVDVIWAGYWTPFSRSSDPVAWAWIPALPPRSCRIWGTLKLNNVFVSPVKQEW